MQADLSLLVSEKEAPDVYNIQDDDGVELGPFVVTPSSQQCSFANVRLTGSLLWIGCLIKGSPPKKLTCFLTVFMGIALPTYGLSSSAPIIE